VDNFLASLNAFSGQFAGFVWGLPLVILLFGAGLIFTVYFAFPQFRLSKHAVDIVAGKYDKPEDKGEITHFQALCAALSATIGLGNIAGVAVAITAGGPGAVFWMWVAGLLGMATKFSSISLSMIYRTYDDKTGVTHGGPMFTIKNALGKGYQPLAILFSISTIAGAIGAGCMFQSNQMAAMLGESFSVPSWVTGAVFTVLTGLVLVGGIKRIGSVAGKLVPTMVVIYFFGALGIVFANISVVPGLFMQIITDAFTGTAAVGGFAGVVFKDVVVQGVRRAVFSNEAGLGSAAMAHSAAKSKPIQEGLVGMLGPFIDTIVVCSLTAIVILITGKWTATEGMAGAELTASAFATLYGSAGTYMITLIVILFAFSSIISWSYYGEQAMVFLFGEGTIKGYRMIFTLFVLVGAVLQLSTILNFSDAFLGLMAIPNLIANLVLTKDLKKELKTYERDLAAGNV
jgi:AGCS family alanine or glycine:cation symporter